MFYSKQDQLQNTKTKKKSKNPRKKLVKDLDDIIRKIIRLRDNKCCSCGRQLEDNMQVSHYIGRRHYSLRWDLRNCHGSCPGCNLLHNHNTLPYTMFMVRTYKEGILEELERIMMNHTKFSTTQLEELLTTYQEKIKQYEKA